MKNILIAFQFLTRLPIKVKNVAGINLARSMAWFPLVGLFVGGLLVLMNYDLSYIDIPPTISAALLVLTLVIITGGLHLDGLADTCDGFYAGQTKEDVLKIMKDTKIGVMGVSGIVLILLLKYVLLVNILSSLPIFFQNICLLFTPMLARWSMVLATGISPAARNEGTGRPFFEHLRPTQWIIATLITFTIVIKTLNLSGLIICAVGLATTLLAVIYFRRRINGLTGDTLGALNEVVEVSTLFTFYLLYRS